MEYFWAISQVVLGTFVAVGIARIVLGFGMSVVDVPGIPAQNKKDREEENVY
jgi:hypothetical protein|tara:strand:+ start:593 stop:748 length:156 start_codon:yes stop_codon:yes gene_type:complete